MHIPLSIDVNCLKTYQLNENSTRQFKSRKINSSNILKWSFALPKTLAEICIETIAKNWSTNPILDELPLLKNRIYLLEILPENLPLTLTIPKINDEIYWEKCYVKRWPKNKLLKINNKTKKQDRMYWKKSFIEMHVNEYLENLIPDPYSSEKIKSLADLCSSYVKNLNLKQMLCTGDSPNKIQLNNVLTGFANLTELSLCMKQKYANDDFSWNLLNTSQNDIKTLSKGLEKLKLKTLRIINSDVDSDKITVILNSLNGEHYQLSTLDFSHCKIQDLTTISAFILKNPVKSLILINNRIDEKSILSLTSALIHSSQCVESLDLSMNKIMDKGGNLLMESVRKSCTLKSLAVCGCRFAFGLTELTNTIQMNKYLQRLDISNNNFENLGNDILAAVSINSTLKKLNLRMCNIDTDYLHPIQAKINENNRRKFQLNQ